MDDKSLNFLEGLSNCNGPSGFEREPATIMKEYVRPYVSSIRNDRLGNLFFEKVGDAEGLAVLIPSHVDE